MVTAEGTHRAIIVLEPHGDLDRPNAIEQLVDKVKVIEVERVGVIGRAYQSVQGVAAVKQQISLRQGIIREPSQWLLWDVV